MKKLSLAGAAFLALNVANSAFAADMARPAYKAPPLPPLPVYGWTGVYVGGNIGYSWGGARTDIAGSATTFMFAGIGGTPGFPSTFSFADSNTVRLDGVVGGGQVGYNYQFSPRWVLGFEADIQGSGERGSNTFLDAFSTRVCSAADTSTVPPSCVATNSQLSGTVATAFDAKIGWFGTVRGRLGVLITDEVLLYGTGGLAYGRVSVSGNANVNTLLTFPGGTEVPFTPAATSFSASKTNVGFAVGGGIEGKLSASWTWKLEYLYLDLGSLDTTSPFPAGSPLGFLTQLTGAISTHTLFRDNIVRVGLNYRFSGR
jgi:outer membrane immunogenic protein